jgi:hypothetical protein
MSEQARHYREAVVARVLTGEGTASVEARQAAFANQGVDSRVRALVDKVARQAWTITDDDVETAKRAGASEDEIFELAVAAALGQATRQLDAALAVLDAALEAEPAAAAAPSDRGSR